MDLEHISRLMEQFDRSQMVEMELEFQGASLHFRKSEGIAAGQNMGVPGQATAGSMSPAPMDASEETSVQDKTSKSNLKEIVAPLAGTFYRAPAPDAEPFVKVGQQIHAGDVIGIIEAMKMMNEVTATADGIVEEILPEDGELVAYDQVLLLIR